MSLAPPRPLVPEDRNGGLERRSLRRGLAAIALAPSRREEPATVAKASWPSDVLAITIAERAASDPAMSGGFPQRQTIAGFQSLAPASALLQLLGRGVTIDLSGVGSALIPTVSTKPQAVFIAEGMPAPVAELSLRATRLGPTRRVRIMAAITQELRDASSAESIVGTVLGEIVARSLDAVGFSERPADDINPPGLLNGAIAVPPSDNMVDDIANLVGAIAAREVDTSNVVIVAGARLATVLSLTASPKFVTPVLSSLALAADAIACFAVQGLSSYLAPPEITASTNAAIHFEDTDPQPIAGPTGELAAPVISAFQSNFVALRCMGRAAWICQPGCASVVKGAHWGGAEARKA
jgi:hypothetical protein